MQHICSKWGCQCIEFNSLVQRQFIEEKNEEQTGTIQRWGDPDNAASTPVEESTPADPQRPLAEKIINELQQGGITVAAYAARNVSQAREFQRQATRFALDHGALGIRRNEVTEGVAMELTESLSSLGDLQENKVPSTAGNVSSSTIQKYIEAQGKD